MNIILPEEDGTSFNLSWLLAYLIHEGRTFIIQGQQNCSLSEHTKDKSLDYWLRKNVARYPDRTQATNELISSICDTGLFYENPSLICPNTGRSCAGIELVPRK